MVLRHRNPDSSGAGGKQGRVDGDWNDLAEGYEFLKDNPLITSGYRIGLGFKGASKSIFQKHNETGNIWTHLIGSFLSVLLAFCVPYFASDQVHKLTDAQAQAFLVPRTIWPIWVFLASGFICLTSSAVFHVYCCVSRKAQLVLRRFDYVGISVLIAGSHVPYLYYMFYCQPHLMVSYIGFNLFCFTIVLIVTLSPRFWDFKYRSVRSTAFILMGISALIPVTHRALLTTSLERWNPIHYLIAMGASYIIGAVFYMTRIPEVLSPGTWNIFGASHQIFHFLILVGFLIHYKAVVMQLNDCAFHEFACV